MSMIGGAASTSPVWNKIARTARVNSLRRVSLAYEAEQARRRDWLESQAPAIAAKREQEARMAALMEQYRTTVVRPVSSRDLLESVALKHGFTLADLTGSHRAHVLVVARQEAMYRLRMERNLSMPLIGKLLNRDHTSVLFGIHSHCNRSGDALPPGMKGTFSKKFRRTANAS